MVWGNKQITSLVVCIIIFLAGWFVLKRATSKEDTQSIVVESGGTATIIQKSAEVKGWEAFIAGYGELNQDREVEYGTRCEIRYYFW